MYVRPGRSRGTAPRLTFRAVAAGSNHEELADGHRLSFAATEETLALIMKNVKAERRCCRFLRFHITVEPDEGSVSVELTGPSGTREFVAALLES
jgi:hypothetical protein